MAETPARPVRTRRALVVLAHGLLTGLLVHLVARDLAWIEATLAQVGRLAPEGLAGLAPEATLAIVAIGLLVAGIGALALWFTPTGTAFALLAVAQLAWILFPYATIPWARLLGGPAGETYTAPASVWVLSALLVGVATVEIALGARDRVVDELDRRRLLDPQGSTASSIRWTHRLGALGGLLVGGLVLAVFAGLHPLAAEAGGDLDLLWAPALAGLVVGLALWRWAR
jgi:hypothetical protein